MVGAIIQRLTEEGEADDRDGALSFISLAGSIIGSLRRYYDSTANETAKALDTVPPSLQQKAADAIAKGLTKCESPIEQALLPWLVTQDYQFFRYSPTVLFAGEHCLYVPRTLAIVPQLPIGRYRVDFALAASLGGAIRFVIVECDGKEFHDGVDNTFRDAERDATIMKNERVLAIVRIPGVEIMRDAQAAAKIAARAVLDAWAKK